MDENAKVEDIADGQPAYVEPQSNGKGDGWQQRPFHPKAPGYKAAKEAIIAQLKKDTIPKSDPECTSTEGRPKDALTSADTAKKIMDGLNTKKDDDCCSAEFPADGKCPAPNDNGDCQIDPNSHEACASIGDADDKTVVMCSDGAKRCIKCAEAANYLAGMIGACNKDGVVSARQAINGQAGLNIQI